MSQGESKGRQSSSQTFKAKIKIWQKRANDLIAEMKANPELVDFLVGMAQDPAVEEAPKGRQATEKDVDNILKI